MRDTRNLPLILKGLEKVNHKKTIKLRTKELSGNAYSLYLDICHNGTRDYHFLKIYILGKKDSKKQDKENLQVAISIRDKKEIELLQHKAEFQLESWKSKANFVEYFKSFAFSKPILDTSWRTTYSHLNNFTYGKIQFNNINEKFCESFKRYLLEKVAVNTAAVNLNIFKICLNKAVKEEIIPKNPAKNVVIKKVDVNREFLTFEEVKKIKETPCDDSEVKNAFLFYCFTVLRLSLIT